MHDDNGIFIVKIMHCLQFSCVLNMLERFVLRRLAAYCAVSRYRVTPPKITVERKIMHRIFWLLLLWPATALAAIDCQALERPLNDMASNDQQVRQESGLLSQDPAATRARRDDLARRWAAVDAANLLRLKEMIATCGWPAGEKASHSAWLLAQHADLDVAFQRQARQLLEAAVANKAAAPRDLAYLADRIATAEGRPQEYGTQFSQSDRCTLELLPVDNLELANRRRLAIGLQSLDEYLAEGRRRFLAADCPAPAAPTGVKIPL